MRNIVRWSADRVGSSIACHRHPLADLTHSRGQGVPAVNTASQRHALEMRGTGLRVHQLFCRGLSAPQFAHGAASRLGVTRHTKLPSASGTIVLSYGARLDYAYQVLRRRLSGSTAIRMIAPLTACVQKGFTFSSTMPLPTTAMIKAPISVPKTPPRPPKRLVPPITTAAMTSSSYPVAAFGSAAAETASQNESTQRGQETAYRIHATT